MGEESPSHGLAVPAPFRQGGQGDGGTDCHSQCAHWLRNDRFLQGMRCKAGGRTEASAPTDGYKKRSTRLGGSSGRPTPTDVLQGMRWGGAM